MHKTLFLISFLLTFNSIAQEIKQTPYPMEKGSLLWEITGNDLSQSSYLFGTMHLIEKEYFLFPKKLKKTLLKSDVLVMELAGLTDQTKAMQYIMLKGDKTFFDFFNQSETDSIYVWAQEKMGMDSTMFKMAFNKFKPFVVTQAAMQMSFAGKTESYEQTFEKIAKEEEIELKGLETIEFQISLFDDLTDEQQAEMIMESIRTPDEATQFMKRMMQLYANQYVDALYQLMEEEGGVISEEQASFLDERNANWIPLIEDIIKTQRAFIAVGAGHLGGPKGVIRLLEARGYELKPVKL